MPKALMMPTIQSPPSSHSHTHCGFVHSRLLLSCKNSTPLHIATPLTRQNCCAVPLLSLRTSTLLHRHYWFCIDTMGCVYQLLYENVCWLIAFVIIVVRYLASSSYSSTASSSSLFTCYGGRDEGLDELCLKIVLLCFLYSMEGNLE